MTRQEAKTKTCGKCKAVKPLTEFHKNVAAPDGLCYNCKACGSAYAKEYRLNPPPPRPDRRAKDGAKRCRICQQSKPVAEFHKMAASPDGWGYECKACQTIEARRFHLKRKFGLTEDDWQQMLVDQKGVCKICSKPETMKLRGKPIPLSVDHCHATGRVRGLLCHKCNGILGLAQDDASVLYRAGDYLG